MISFGLRHQTRSNSRQSRAQEQDAKVMVHEKMELRGYFVDDFLPSKLFGKNENQGIQFLITEVPIDTFSFVQESHHTYGSLDNKPTPEGCPA